MFRKKQYFALGAVTLVTVLVLSLPSSEASHLRLAIGGLFLPLFGLASTGQQLPGEAVEAVLPRRELLKQIENLRRENQQLKVEQLQAAFIAQENDQLRALVGWQRQQPWKLKLARVIMRDPANWWHTMQIDLGSRDGVREDLPVLTSEGLVGRVSSVGLTSSQVVLIDDPHCRVSVRVENAAQDMGILSVSEPMDNSLLNLTYLPGNAILKPGQAVVTSGQGGFFPPGIPIGQIVDSRQVEFGFYTEARVKLSADLGTLNEVWVLFP
ncbi:MAG TPA: rod shape-determining protein MreC [Candidatus Acidoferrales bacterium]|nr:rod shape-determining protein MreC [Candidatus Acidoferrales bacterium]